MYQLNVNSTDFKQRSKSAFDVLSTLESTHRTKADEYVDKEEEKLAAYEPKTGELNPPSLSEPLRDAEPKSGDEDDFVFKVPRVPELHSDKKSGKRRHSQPPDHVKNPQKWTRYSLEDVEESEMNANANRKAALDFLKSRQNEQEQDDDESEEAIVYNRPIGGARKYSDFMQLKDTAEEASSVEPKFDLEASIEQRQEFRKKASRKNFRKMKDIEEDSEEAAVDSSPTSAETSHQTLPAEEEKDSDNEELEDRVESEDPLA